MDPFTSPAGVARKEDRARREPLRPVPRLEDARRRHRRPESVVVMPRSLIVSRVPGIAGRGQGEPERSSARSVAVASSPRPARLTRGRPRHRPDGRLGAGPGGHDRAALLTARGLAGTEVAGQGAHLGSVLAAKPGTAAVGAGRPPLVPSRRASKNGSDRSNIVVRRMWVK